MKKIYLLIWLLAGFSSIAQITQTDSIAEAEMKSASSLMNLAVNPNTLNYDVTYHKLEFIVDPAEYFISGNVTTTFTALEDMSTVTFDLTDQLTVSTVTMGDEQLEFLQNGNNELVITLPGVQPEGTTATVEIYYFGEPGFGEDAFTTSTHNGVPILSTLSEPYGARDWWPCKQDLNDKVDSVDIYIIAPMQYISVSNGLEMSRVEGDVMATTHFHHGYPIPAYLIAIAVTNYSIFTQTAGTAPNQFPIINYIYPEDLADAVPQLAVTLPIMNLFESLFEPYPYRDEKYGHAQFNYPGGMEHTTVSFMGGFGRNLIAHELAHQWFGDKITCGSWQDIWLNEGFAEYLSGLVVENLDGNNDFISWKESKTAIITSQSGGAVYLTEEETQDVGRIFSSRLSYNKGAMVLNMLRLKLGDEHFFQGIKNYLADPALAFGYAVTDDLQSHLESVSGLDLDEFFSDWVYNQGFPWYNVTATNIAPGKARFVVSQGQSHGSVDFFEMPLPIRVFGLGGQSADLILDNTENGQTFIADVPFSVIGFFVDPERDIITGFNSETLSTGDFDILEAIVLSPNPASSTIGVSLPNNIRLEKATISNILGQMVMKSESATQWDISALSTGVHFLTLTTDAGTRVLKFIRE